MESQAKHLLPLSSQPVESKKSPEPGPSNYVTVVEFWYPLETPSHNVCAYFRNAKGNFRLYELRHTVVSR